MFMFRIVIKLRKHIKSISYSSCKIWGILHMLTSGSICVKPCFSSYPHPPGGTQHSGTHSYLDMTSGRRGHMPLWLRTLGECSLFIFYFLFFISYNGWKNTQTLVSVAKKKFPRKAMEQFGRGMETKRANSFSWGSRNQHQTHTAEMHRLLLAFSTLSHPSSTQIS